MHPVRSRVAVSRLKVLPGAGPSASSIVRVRVDYQIELHLREPISSLFPALIGRSYIIREAVYVPG